MTAKLNRAPATKYLNVIDRINEVSKSSGVSKAALSEMLDMEYVTLYKYLSRERNINGDIAKQMTYVTDILDKMLAVDILPIPKEINYKKRTKVILSKVNEFIENN